MSYPNFKALREARTEAFKRQMQQIADEHGIPVESLTSNYNPNACYCACPGLCEHTWDGEWFEFEDGCGGSATCSRCGATAMSHDMRFLP